MDTTVTVTVTDAAEAPAFGEESYAFELAENVDGRVNGLSLGTVTATDPDLLVTIPGSLQRAGN